jgi:hypothetical protein
VLKTVLVILAATLWLAGCGGSRDPAGADVRVIALEVAESSGAGEAIAFRATLGNAGPGNAEGVAVAWTSGGAVAAGPPDVECVPGVGVACPSALGATMTLAALPAGRSITFVYRVPVAVEARGDLSGTVSVASAGDPDTGNDSATAVTRVVDASNGVYRVFAADAREYQLEIDVDAGSYTMSGNGHSSTRAFAVDPSGDLVVGGANARLRTAADLVVGGHDFGRGVLPFVAARRFASDPASLAGAFNLVTLNVAADGSGRTTRAATAQFSGNELAVCQDDFQVAAARNCPVGSVRTYALAASGDVITGTDVVPGRPSFAFRIARSGLASILLAAGPSTSGRDGDDTLQLRLGLLDGPQAGLPGGGPDRPYRGPALGADTQPDWLTIVLEPTSYAALGANIDDVAGLVRPSASAPLSMLAGAPTPALGGAPVWVMQSLPLVVVFGNATAPAGTPNASGLMQIAVP